MKFIYTIKPISSQTIKEIKADLKNANRFFRDDFVLKICLLPKFIKKKIDKNNLTDYFLNVNMFSSYKITKNKITINVDDVFIENLNRYVKILNRISGKNFGIKFVKKTMRNAVKDYTEIIDEKVIE